MANALHFVDDQQSVLQVWTSLLRKSGRLLVVEYDVHSPRPWIPRPVPFTHFCQLAQDVGLAVPEMVGMRRSPSTGVAMFAAVAS